jgi:GNAT superfamily N-acetyltransferase
VRGGWLRGGWSGDPGEAWFVPGPEPGGVVAWYRLELPDLENRDRAGLHILVHPARRGRGIGRALLRHAAERAGAAGRVMLTTVSRPHRGHRLGLLVKTAMLEWLAAAEPKLERIQTGNAADNEHMIAVNDALGFELCPPAFHTVELGVADALGRVAR